MSKKKPGLQFLKNAVLSVLKQSPSSLNNKQISWALNLKGSEYQKLILRAIKELKQDDLIIELSKYRYSCRISKQCVSGVIDINSSGNGYVITDSFDVDIFVSKSNLLNALNGDIVSVKITQNSRNKLIGKVVGIVKRNRSKFTGLIEQNNCGIFFVPDNIKTSATFCIPPNNTNGAKHGNRVIVEFIRWGPSDKNPVGHVVSVLPKEHSLKSEITSTLEIFNIRAAFSSKVMEEAKKITSKITTKDRVDRKDFRQYSTFTIDPDDAKDFDDAISIRCLDSGITEIGIHIADVSHYVPVNSEIDKEAFLRAFSLYFPGRVIPMLPETLSNKICSLNPNEDKLCFSVVVGFDKDLKTVRSTWIGKTLINSNKRFTYNDANKLISKKKGGLFAAPLITLNAIATNLREARIKSGSIDFERSDIDFVLNNAKEPIKLIKKTPLAAHKLIEEFMLLANKIVANKLSGVKKSIYRVHDLPDKEKLKEVANYLKYICGDKISFNVKKSKLHILINRLLNEDSLIVNKGVFVNLILRTMAKACYSTENIGHFGLGFEKYTHFTSPIRRYADLVVHRLLENLISQNDGVKIDFKKQCQHFSLTEKIYVDIERKTIKFIQLMLLEKSIGKVLSGVITGVVRWGIYIDINGWQGEGLVASRKLNNNNYYYNEIRRAFINKKNGEKYVLGQSLPVKIESVNLLKHEMDLTLLNY